MTLKIYSVVLELVRRIAPFLPKLRARSASLFFAGMALSLASGFSSKALEMVVEWVEIVTAGGLYR